MLRKRSRPVQKDQSKGYPMADSNAESCLPSNGLVQKVRNSSLFTVPCLFVGFSNKGLLDSEAARSPRSPLDFKCSSGIRGSFLSSPISPGGGGKPRFWVDSRVGLSLVDTLNDESKLCEKVVGVSESRNILLGSHMRMNISRPKCHLSNLRDDSLRQAPKSLPKECGVTLCHFIGSPKPCVDGSKIELQPKRIEFELGEIRVARSCSEEIRQLIPPPTRSLDYEWESNSEAFLSDGKKSALDSWQSAKGSISFDSFSRSIPAPTGSSHELIGFLSPNEIEQSEDYTCIISHGPNPKTTHFFGDCILDGHIIQSQNFNNKLREEGKGSAWLLKPSADLPPYPSVDFLSFCFSCKKKLDEGHDIYIYRGEKAFCSSECRDQEILIEEEMEKPELTSSDSRGSSFHEVFFEG